VRELADSGDLWKYYERAEKMLAAGHHPRALELTKVQRVKQRADQLTDAQFGPMPIAVNFTVDGENAVGVAQKPCIDCGDCITGCNVSAKNTLYMNYLPYARKRGANIYTGVEVLYLEPGDGGGWTVHFRRNDANGHGPPETLRAKNVVLAGGTLGSTEILLRSAAHGLNLSGRLGEGFSGNGDFLALGYNGDFRTDVLGFGNRPDSPWAAVRPGPTIVSGIRYDLSKPLGERILIQDFTTFPSGLVKVFRHTLPGLALTGEDTDSGVEDETAELKRVARDQLRWDPDGAVNHSMVYLVMAIDDGGGRMRLDEKDKLRIEWPSLRNDPIFKEIGEEVLAHARTLGATYVHLDRWNPWTGMGNLVTAHPLGGCGLGDDADSGVVDDGGRVFDGAGGTHPGLHVVDGAIVPMPLAVNPLLTISALAERIAEGLSRAPGG
jgi:cholesterol oxidase